jgi:agmatinase
MNLPVDLPLTQAPRFSARTFLNWPRVTNLEALKADIALLGIPYNAPYSMEEVANDQTKAPDAVRNRSDQIQWGDGNYDFDQGGPLLDGKTVRLADCGNVPGNQYDAAGNLKRAELAVRAILKAGALPIILGGDHGSTVPALRAYEGRGPITLVHIDAHLDWRDSVNGVRDGYSSPIRRASELSWIAGAWQIGLRGVGSARLEEVADARRWGSNLITAWDLQEMGIKALLDRLPTGKNVYLTIDADGLDPSVMPGVIAPVPGGLTFAEARAIIHHCAQKNRLVGMDIVEISPALDVGGLSAITAGRLIANAVGCAVRAGYWT